jgi:hypothetical protein
MNARRIAIVALLLLIASPVAAQDSGGVLLEPLPDTVVHPLSNTVVHALPTLERVPSRANVSRATRARLLSQLRARRALNLQRFAAYHRAGVFPDNHVQPGMLNVFIDDEGHICAAANLIALDGLRNVVEDQAQTDNYIRLADVHSGALYEWMLMSGFTQEEIAEIQEPYAYIPDEPFGDPEPIEPTQPTILALEQQERERLQRRLLEVEGMLRRNARASLQTAVDRLIEYRIANGIALDAPVSASSIAMNTVEPAPAWQRVSDTVVRTAGFVGNVLPSAIVWRPGMPRPEGT